MRSSASSNQIGEALLQTISENKMIIAYMDKKIIPSIDELLDRRLLVKEMFFEGLLHKHWVEAEILAIDFLLSKYK